MKRSITFIFLLLVLLNSKVRAQSEPAVNRMRLKFIDKVEIFGGPNLSFNYGNMFIENYKGDYSNGNYVENRRLSKIGYSFGVGMFHKLNERFDFNVRVQWEQKGSKAELNHPVNPSNNADRQFITNEYTYNYLTLPIVVKFYFGKNKNLGLSLGGYVSRIKSVYGEEDYDYPDDNEIQRSPISVDFRGRSLVGFDNEGGINASTFLPGLRSFKDYDYGLVLGLSYTLEINAKNAFVLQLEDKYGITNINKPSFTPISNPSEKNHSISISIGYLYSRYSKY